jgi:uncharacterized protein (UPF0333 family)
MTIWAFAMVTDDDARQKVYNSIFHGKSRFGWSGSEDSDLRKKWDGKQAFLLSVEKDDWIVHVNSPSWGKCVAVQVVDKYEFDEGLECDWGRDFRHCIPVNPETLIEFERNSDSVLPTVNLNPRQRYHRIYNVDDFLKSIEQLRDNQTQFKVGDSKGIHYLKQKSTQLLSKTTSNLHETHKGKDLERFLAKVFKRMPNVVEVIENGFGWGTDYGADLIITTISQISNIQFEHKIVVQVKSYENEHWDLSAVDQIGTAIERYKADAAMLITTAQRTDALESSISELSERLNKPIDLVAGDDVSKFVIKYAADLMFELDY